MLWAQPSAMSHSLQLGRRSGLQPRGRSGKAGCLCRQARQGACIIPPASGLGAALWPAAHTAVDCLMLWKLTLVGEVGMDMARATRALIECLSCHRCHLFRIAERTCGHRMTGDIRAQAQDTPAPSPASSRLLQAATRCHDRICIIHVITTVGLLFVESVFSSEEGTPFSSLTKVPSGLCQYRTPTLPNSSKDRPYLLATSHAMPKVRRGAVLTGADQQGQGLLKVPCSNPWDLGRGRKGSPGQKRHEGTVSGLGSLSPGLRFLPHCSENSRTQTRRSPEGKKGVRGEWGLTSPGCSSPPILQASARRILTLTGANRFSRSQSGKAQENAGT